MNKELLQKTVKFPLKWDLDEYKMYIFDADMNMIAQVDDDNLDAIENEHPFEKLIGDFKEVPVTQTGQRYFLYQGDFYDQNEGKRIGLVRGWGGITSELINQGHENWEELGTEIQDNIAEYILTIINQGE